MNLDEEMESNGQLKRKNPTVIYSDKENDENISVQTVSPSVDTNMNIVQRETQEQRSQSVANNNNNTAK